MALHQRDAAGGAKEETGELYGDGGGAEAGQPAHARGPVPKWSEQLTARGLVVSAAVGIMYSVIVMKLNLTTGLDPTLTSPPRSSPSSSSASGRTRRPASASPSARSRARRTPSSRHAPSPATASAPPVGLGPICLGSARRPTRPAGTDIEGNVGWKEPGIGWMTGYLFAVSFVGILALVPLRKILVIDYKLTYPSGTATAVLINGFHAPQGDDVAKMQVKGFTKYFAISFFWSFFQWFYSGGDKCGFSQFPTLGLRARKQTFFFDFNLTYVGAGMICPHLINISLLLGSILSYGIMWPLISDLKGNWAFICIALILGDGMYNFAKIIVSTIWSIVNKSEKKNTKKEEDILSLDDLHRNEVFTRESLPNWIAFLGYFGLSLVAVITIPLMFPEIKWYYAIIAYLLAPALGFSNAYGSALLTSTWPSTMEKLLYSFLQPLLEKNMV
ncbi:hypothetical protein ACQ4PT_010825 [Festuca glaucescens]